MTRPSCLPIATAVARSVAAGLGLEGLPWLGTYVLGRDLARRAAKWVAAGQG